MWSYPVIVADLNKKADHLPQVHLPSLNNDQLFIVTILGRGTVCLHAHDPGIVPVPALY